MTDLAKLNDPEHVLATSSHSPPGAAGPAVTSALVTPDGELGWESLGSGPSVVVVPGALRLGKHYRGLAELLGDRFTLHLMDRRGRGRSPASLPLRSSDVDGRATLDREIGDLAKVVEATGARRVLGHSGGGLIALEAAARGLPLERLAVYEPAVSVAGSLPTSWVPAFEDALGANDSARAFALVAQGLEVGPPAWLPAWLLAIPLQLLFRGDDGKEMAALLRTLPSDIAFGRAADAPDASRFAAVTCPTLVLHGDKSPRYLLDAARAVTAAIAGARRVVVAGAGHNAPDLAPALVAKELAAFFA